MDRGEIRTPAVHPVCVNLKTMEDLEENQADLEKLSPQEHHSVKSQSSLKTSEVGLKAAIKSKAKPSVASSEIPTYTDVICLGSFSLKLVRETLTGCKSIAAQCFLCAPPEQHVRPNN